MNVLKKFIELTETIHAHGSEDQMKIHLPEGTRKDEAGNYFLQVGESQSMFTAHLDTVAGADTREVKHIIEEDDNRTIVRSDGKTILGADDRSGVLVLLYMIEYRVPGLYYFFIGEEVGRIGSQKIAAMKTSFFYNYKRCVSFDRKGFGSIISEQGGVRCCSQLFADSLADELTDYTGIPFFNDAFGGLTDSGSFKTLIPECTNVSVGYYNPHSRQEYQDITYLEELCMGVTKVNWERLAVD